MEEFIGLYDQILFSFVQQLFFKNNSIYAYFSQKGHFCQLHFRVKWCVNLMDEVLLDFSVF